MKKKVLLISALILITTSISIANNRSDAENQCRSKCNEQRNTCRDICFNDHKNDNNYIAMNQCQDKCNPISNKCDDACAGK
ncbi:hypothetical protein ACFPDQ_05410 [Pseudofrancisella aestuarii]|uniref:Uncharacterized protein n=1 Tax=Pseudofrancisella aestuarii TaxID=2670347 RepID=A0ABV9TD27_9GAMM|nr:hypothetical protein [Pseudofrancisella aestuarii]